MLNISFLQKTPVWVFFCFCAVCILLCAPVESYATATSGPAVDLSVLDKTMNDFRNITYSWQNTFQKAAKTLFWLLVPVAMVWRFGQIAMQGGGATEALAELFRFTIFVGFYYELCSNGIHIANLVFTSILDLTTKASGFLHQTVALQETVILHRPALST